MSEEVQHLHVTYNEIHDLIRRSTPKIAAEYNPNLLIAIGRLGFFPARVMRTFLRRETQNNTLQIQAIGLSLYEPVEGSTVDQIGVTVIRTQWLGPNSGKLLLGRRNLIVDEVDDSRKTLHYAVSELKKDVETELLSYPDEDREALRAATHFAVFVVHNKTKPKLAGLPEGTRYFSGAEVGNVWLEYPWEAINIEEHDLQAALDRGNDSFTING
ncbi:PRTase-like protein [Phlegmacium glaucopus]|nr:PRTase-like protein [Phlegmacium glaucopus]